MRMENARGQFEGGLVAVDDDDHRRGQDLERLDADVAEPAVPMASAVALGSRAFSPSPAEPDDRAR
jgi:hypothetical protein